MKVTILGCGASPGVPVIGCDCAVCRSNYPQNQRRRVSIFIEINGINLLVDTSPDLRMQALDNNIRQVDAILYTHAHADHTQGVDEVRSFNHLKNDSIPVFADHITMEALQTRFAYLFQPKPEGSVWYRGSLMPHIIPNILDHTAVQEFKVSDVVVTALEQGHGKVKSLGYRVGNLTYSTDVKTFSDEVFEAMMGTEIWIVDCLRYTESPTHSWLDNTLEWIARVKPRQAILTHMGHELDYDTLSSKLPEGVIAAYDNLVIEL